MRFRVMLVGEGYSPTEYMKAGASRPPLEYRSGWEAAGTAEFLGIEDYEVMADFGDGEFVPVYFDTQKEEWVRNNLLRWGKG